MVLLSYLLDILFLELDLARWKELRSIQIGENTLSPGCLRYKPMSASGSGQNFEYQVLLFSYYALNRVMGITKLSR